MSRGVCPRLERDGCPVANRKGGCFSDNDHIVAQKFRHLGLLVSKYIDTPTNQVQICRWEHEQKDDDAVELPSEEFMLEAVRQAYAQGQLALNKRDRQRLLGGANGTEVDRGVAMVPPEHAA